MTIHKNQAGEFLDRAIVLAPTLRERTGEAERMRRLPPASVTDLKAAGMFKVLRAARHGGAQLGLAAFIDIVAALGRGCGASAWCTSVANAHNWLLGLYPAQAQDEVVAGNPGAVVAAVIGPRGKARATDGGYVLESGFWPFCSGITFADWVILGALVQDEAGTIVDEGDFLVPAGDITIRDDWDVVGLTASGSNSVTAQNLFVPAHRYLSMRAAMAGERPGAGLHEGSLYRSAIVPVLALALAPPTLGIAEAALTDFIRRLPGKTVAYTQNEVQIEMPTTHRQVGEAAVKISTARTLLHRVAADIEAAAAADADPPLARRAGMRVEIAYAVRLCLEAVETLMLASGGAGIAAANPIQRAWRDLHAINMHGLMGLETNLEMYGRIVLGLPQNTPLI